MRHPFTVQAFSAWLDKQPPDKSYWYFSREVCALAQYAQSLGMTYEQLPCEFAARMNSLVCSPDGRTMYATFGQAAAKARQYATFM